MFSFFLLAATTAEAKRFGGGSSFGGKSSYSSPFKKNTSPQKSFSQQKAASTNQQKRQQMASRGGLMGMLGGLALGGLLGALFFGGAFEGFNFFDFLIIGLVIFAIYWFMIKRKTPAPQARTNSGQFDIPVEPQHRESSESETSRNASDQSDKLFKTTPPAAPGSEQLSSNDKASFSSSNKQQSFAESFGMKSGAQNEAPQAHNDQVILPDWFDQQEFISGARSAYTMLQEAWDSGDLDTIRTFTTEAVFDEIQHQHESEPSAGATKIVQLNAQLMDFNELDDHCEAAVLFDALLAESDSAGQQGRAAQVRELWHFVRKNDSNEPTWYLDGIQQLES
jgi:predicted lipid-binding transport protein (Tim44 family)